jgi:hypothetical protein
MPYGERKTKSGKTQVYNKSSGHVYGTHDSKKQANKQLAAIKINTSENYVPRMTEVFSVSEGPQNLSQQLKTARPVAPATITQQSQDALKNQKQALQGAAKQQGTTVKVGKTDANNPIANVFVTKPDGSADVLDGQTGMLKPVPGIDQSKPSDPMKNTGVSGGV